MVLSTQSGSFSNSASLSLSGRSGAEYIIGSVPLFEITEVAFTADEVKNIYLSVKGMGMLN